MVLRKTPPLCSNLPTKSFPFSEKVFISPPRSAMVARQIFVPVYGQYGFQELGFGVSVWGLGSPHPTSCTQNLMLNVGVLAYILCESDRHADVCNAVLDRTFGS